MMIKPPNMRGEPTKMGIGPQKVTGGLNDQVRGIEPTNAHWIETYNKEIYITRQTRHVNFTNTIEFEKP